MVKMSGSCSHVASLRISHRNYRGFVPFCPSYNEYVHTSNVVMRPIVGFVRVCSHRISGSFDSIPFTYHRGLTCWFTSNKIGRGSSAASSSGISEREWYSNVDNNVRGNCNEIGNGFDS